MGGAAPLSSRSFALNDLAVYNYHTKDDIKLQFQKADTFEFLLLLPKLQALVLIKTDTQCLAVDSPLELALACMPVSALKACAA
jgi:hypothetical protein